MGSLLLERRAAAPMKRLPAGAIEKNERG